MKSTGGGVGHAEVERSESYRGWGGSCSKTN